VIRIESRKKCNSGGEADNGPNTLLLLRTSSSYKVGSCQTSREMIPKLTQVCNAVCTAIIMVQASEACIDSAHRNPCPSFYVTGWHRLRSLVSAGTRSYISIRQNGTSVPRKMRCFRKQGSDEIPDRRCVRGISLFSNDDPPTRLLREI